ncbi:hypothetical protein FRB94_013283 [Tulasnella sp. JGI-2019a]|nr:hypothetical protein FRB93_007958 [Tulasnella sp. JGI-2019a]KAG8990578.1 hypothetical protein FRB94_013283 [Tulasnella sp. JGI-2019a]KAG9030825.1 hypothetical protein FRB95_003517 [Tulasnella sp. JGI-2019a]
MVRPPPLTADNDDLAYKLPELVESQRQGWIYSAQAAAVVSVLFCGAETQLIASIKGDGQPMGGWAHIGSYYSSHTLHSSSMRAQQSPPCS